jgi:tetratricopeptide (TPR) repeat protein
MSQVYDSRGVQTGDHNVQINLFSGEQPRGPVVAGSVPQAPPAFQPRDDLMTQLRVHGPGVSVVRAVTGLRGVGKTQLAAAYARECIDAGWRLVAWVNAEDTPSILAGLEAVAARLGIDKPGTALETIATEVRNRVEADGEKCLLVYDNVTNPAALRPYLPAAGKSQVIVTSTQASALSLGDPTEVAVFTEQEARDFLADRTGHGDPSGADDVAGELGHLPLALAQAAAVIRTRHLSYEIYLTRLRAYPVQRYLPATKADPYPRGVAEAILLSIDTVVAADQTGLCADLLAVISLLSADGVSRDLLYHGQPDNALAADEEVIDEALANLADASLVTFGGEDASSPAVTAHRLVMRVTRERRAHGGDLVMIGTKAAATLVNARDSLGEGWPWERRQADRDLVQQVISLNDHLSTHLEPHDKPVTEALLSLRSWGLWYLNARRDSLKQAVELGESLVADQGRILGEGHRETLSSRGNLAVAYRAARRLDEAIPFLEQTLADCQRVLGEADPGTLAAQGNLAAAYREAGRADEAVSLLERVLAAYTQLRGADDLDTIYMRNALAIAYREADRADEAVQLLERAAADFARLQGADNPDTLISQSELAVAYQASGRLGEAVPLLEQTVADFTRVLGEQHPSTLEARSCLADFYLEAGRLDEAVLCYERTVADRLRALGEDHPDTLTSLSELANAYQQSGRPDVAALYYAQTMSGRVRVLGEDHPDTLTSLSDLASAHWEAGGFDLVIPLYEEALAGFERVLGPDHPHAVAVRENLAAAWDEAGRHKEQPSSKGSPGKRWWRKWNRSH